MIIEGTGKTTLSMSKCPICGRLFKEFGNNPEPVMPSKDGKCCDACNMAVVIPTRLFISERINSVKRKEC